MVKLSDRFWKIKRHTLLLYDTMLVNETYIGGNNMCQIDYNTNKKEKKYSHINYTEI